jgi:arginine N-succinyltransferase
MSFMLRPAGPGDLEALYQMAKSTGGGFTNLPPDRDTLAEKLSRSAAALARVEEVVADDLFVFALVDGDGHVRGTCQIFSRVGAALPFYSYRVGTMTQVSRELGRTFRAEMLTLSTDLDGSSEVGGLYLHPQERSAGTGALLARSRYLFIRSHRARFGERMIAELRGAIDDTGGSPFWDGLAGRFFGMSFREADEFNAKFGNQFIADLMPKHPIYTAMLPETALGVMGVPHKSGRAAMRMLESEGFRFENYVDIFDGGPTVTIATDQIATIRHARDAVVTTISDGVRDCAPCLVAAGHLAEFRAALGCVAEHGEGVTINVATAALLGLTVGDSITHVPRSAA